jgi:hypothetical protein
MVLDTNDQPGQLSDDNDESLDEAEDKTSSPSTREQKKNYHRISTEQRRSQKVDKILRIMRKQNIGPGYFFKHFLEDNKYHTEKMLRQ